MIIVYILIILLVVLGLYLVLLYPGRSRKKQMLPFTQHYIAHRGLFDNATSAPENSMSAFRKAIEAGYGFELDVQLTCDNEVVVFHDHDLKRSSGVNIKISDCSFAMLQEHLLFSSEEQIPKFADVLNMLYGQVPVIVELKSDSVSEYHDLCERVAGCLDSYDGPFCIESFNPMIVQWFKIHRPAYLRGFLSTDFFKRRLPISWVEKFVLTNCLTNFFTRPDFIAYDIRYRNQLSNRICTWLYGLVRVGWTVQNEEELRRMEAFYDVIIFDSFLP